MTVACEENRDKESSCQKEENLAKDGFGADDPFKSIRYNRNTRLENQKFALALLDATETTIREQGLLLLPENYFKALWPLVDNEEKEKQSKMNPASAVEFNVAIIYLLSFVAPHLPAEFIKEAYGEMYAKLGTALGRFLEIAPFVRAAIIVIGSILEAFNVEEWELRTSLKDLSFLLLRLCIDQRPKVRKLAQDTVAKLVNDNNSQVAIRSLLVAFSVEVVLSKATRKDCVNALHMVAFLNGLVSKLNGQDIDLLPSHILKCASLGNSHLTTSCFSLLAHIAEDANLRNISLTGGRELLLDGILPLQPKVTMSDLVPSWISVLVKLMIFNKDDLDNEVLLRLFKTLFSVFQLFDSVLILQHITDDLKLVYHLIKEESVGENVCQELVRLLSVKNLNAAPYIIQTITDYCLETAVSKLPVDLLKALADLHDSKQSKHANLIEKTISSMITQFGPEAVLQVIPLNLIRNVTSKEAFPRAWLLPLLKEAVSHSKLSFFKEHLLSLADQIAERTSEFKKEKKFHDAKVYELINGQLWSCLPAFMTFPIDFCSTFPSLAPVLGKHLAGTPKLRPVIVQALISFISRARSFELGDPDNNYPNAMEDLALITSNASNFLPILLNIYGVTPSEQREHLLRGIEAFLSVIDVDVVRVQYFERVIGKLEKESKDPEELVTFLELSLVIIKFLDLECHERLMKTCLCLLSGEQESFNNSPSAVTVQKRLYRVIGDVLAREDIDISALIETLETVLLSNFDSKLPSAVKKMRFRAILKLTSKLPDDALHWIPLFLPEVILGTKEVNQQARLYAFELLLSFARRMSRGGLIQASRSRGMISQDAIGSLNEFMTILLAGLAGATPHMISATIMSLARIIFEFRDMISKETISMLVGDIIGILASASREVVKSALGFLKVILSLTTDKGQNSNYAIEEHLPALVDGVLNWSNEHRQQFKVRVRHLMERLIRKFGVERIWSLTPVEHRKLVTNIRKRRERAKRQKSTDTKEDVTEEGSMSTNDNFDAITSRALTGVTAMTKMTSFTSIKPSKRFESTINDSESDLGSDEDYNEEGYGSDQDQESDFEIPTDSILHDIGNMDDEDQIDNVLSKKLSLVTSLGKRQKKNTLLSSGSSKQARGGNDDQDDDYEDDKFVRMDQDRLIINDGMSDSEVDSEAETEAKPNTGKRSISRVRFDNTANAHGGNKKNKGDAKKKSDKFEPYSYLPMTRSTKKKPGNMTKDKSATEGNKRTGKPHQKYFMKRA